MSAFLHKIGKSFSSVQSIYLQVFLSIGSWLGCGLLSLCSSSAGTRFFGSCLTNVLVCPENLQLTHIFVSLIKLQSIFLFFPGGSEVKASASNAGDPGLIPGSGRSPGGGRGNPLLRSCLEHLHGQRSLVGYCQRVAKSRTRLKQLSMHAY